MRDDAAPGSAEGGEHESGVDALRAAHETKRDARDRRLVLRGLVRQLWIHRVIDDFGGDIDRSMGAK